MYLKAREVAKHYAVSLSTVYEWAHDEEAIREGVVVWIGKRRVSYHPEKLAEWIAKRSLRLRGLRGRVGRPRTGVRATATDLS